MVQHIENKSTPVKRHKIVLSKRLGLWEVTCHCFIILIRRAPETDLVMAFSIFTDFRSAFLENLIASF